MTYFKSTEKILETLPDLNKEKKLSKLLGTNFLLEKIRILGKADIGNFRIGSIFLLGVFGGLGWYWNHKNYQKTFMTSQNYYKMTDIEKINANSQFWWNWDGRKTSFLTPSYYYKMPKKVYDIKYRMRGAYIEGNFDHNKEILIPRKKNGADGYDVITPFYYYDRVENSQKYAAVTPDGKFMENQESLRGAMAVHRGW